MYLGVRQLHAIRRDTHTRGCHQRSASQPAPEPPLHSHTTHSLASHGIWSPHDLIVVSVSATGAASQTRRDYSVQRVKSEEVDGRRLPGLSSRRLRRPLPFLPSHHHYYLLYTTTRSRYSDSEREAGCNKRPEAGDERWTERLQQETKACSSGSCRSSRTRSWFRNQAICLFVSESAMFPRG